MKKGLVSNWMSSPVVTVTPETHLTDARRIMNAEKIRVLPVMRGEQIAGIVTRRGLLRTDLSSLDGDAWKQEANLQQGLIQDIMTVGVITTIPNALIPKVARVMMENKITSLPVVDDKQKLVGIITSSDLFRVVIEEVPGLKEPIKVRDYMTREVVSVDPQTSLLEAHRLMGVQRIRALPVLEDEKLVGVVTRTDLMAADPSRFMINGNGHHQDLARMIESEKVMKIMSRNLVTIQPDAPITEAARLFLENKIHCLPVLDEKNNMVGIITESDLFRLIVSKFF